jgi:predicted branched-subunit amino acid permease
MELFISCTLYAILSGALYHVGVDLIDKPLEWLAIMLLVLLIDIRHVLLN